MKKILVTGGNKGIGYAICFKLLRDYPDVYVLLGSRDPVRGQAAIEQLRADVGPLLSLSRNRVELIILDTSSQESVSAAAASQANGSLYGIVNNAAIGHGRDQKTTLATNYWGVRAVTKAFLPKLQTQGGRVVNVSSAAAPLFITNALPAEDPIRALLTAPWKVGSIEALDHLARTYRVRDEGPDAWYSYGFSKALVNCYTWLMSRKYPLLVMNSVTPGLVDTEMASHISSTTKKTTEQGAIPILFCLLDDEIVAQSPQGRFYGSDCVRSPFHASREPGDPVYEGPDDETDES